MDYAKQAAEKAISTLGFLEIHANYQETLAVMAFVVHLKVALHALQIAVLVNKLALMEPYMEIVIKKEQGIAAKEL